MPITTTRLRSLVVATTVCLSIACALTGAGAARAGSTVAAATPIAVGGNAVGAIRGAGKPQFYAIDLDLAQRVRISFDTPYAGGLTARLFRPGVDDDTLEAARPRNTVQLAKGLTARDIIAARPLDHRGVRSGCRVIHPRCHAACRRHTGPSRRLALNRHG